MLQFLPNKKILMWCGEIEHAKNMYKEVIKYFNENNIDIPIYIDHSKLEKDDKES